MFLSRTPLRNCPDDRINEPRRVEDPTGSNIGGLDDAQVVDAHDSGRDVAIGLPESGAVERVAHPSGIGEVRLDPPQREVVSERLAIVAAEAVVLLGQHPFGDGDEFVIRVVRELDVMGDPRPEPGFEPKNRSMRSGYPARITTRSSR